MAHKKISAKNLKMYYDNKYGEPMKKLFLISLLFSVCALGVQATTCEVRVDAHQKASTMQRVDYCLNAPDETDDSLVAEVIYYGVVNPQEDAEAEAKATAKNGYYDDSKMKVSRGYFGTRNFPAFTNDTLSENERARQREQLAKAKQQILEQQAQRNNVGTPVSVPAPSVLAQEAQPEEVQPVKAVVSVETRQGVLQRQKKPARFDKALFFAEPEPVAAVQPQSEVVVPEEQPVDQPVAEPEQFTGTTMQETQSPSAEYNPYYESGVAVSAPVTYDQISQN